VTVPSRFCGWWCHPRSLSGDHAVGVSGRFGQVVAVVLVRQPQAVMFEALWLVVAMAGSGFGAVVAGLTSGRCPPGCAGTGVVWLDLSSWSRQHGKGGVCDGVQGFGVLAGLAEGFDTA
jgi:hypothetical protein